MESIREIYRVGQGPSSSHTMGPAKASRMFLEKYPAADHYRVTLYGSLAATGKGHLTDEAVLYTVRRGGAAGRKGDTIGALICANFGCSRNARQLPPAYHKGTDLDALREQRVAELRRKVHGFVDEVLSTEE